MGTDNEFRIDIAVPAAAVAALAAALRERFPWTLDWVPALADVEAVALALYSAEGGSEWPDDPHERTADALHIRCAGFGRVSFDAWDVEDLYAAHGATGVVECLYEGDSDRLLVVLRDGAVERFQGVTIYPGHDALEPALDLLRRMGPDQLRLAAAEAQRLLADPPSADRPQNPLVNVHDGPLPVPYAWADRHAGQTWTFRFEVGLHDLLAADGLDGMNEICDATTGAVLAEVSYRVVRAGDGPTRSVLIEATGTVSA